nr:hypothetical protein [Tanacetum cinerariifolium]
GRPNYYAAGTSGTRANTSGIKGNYSSQQRVVKCFNCQGEGHMAIQCLKPKRKRDATWFRDKVLLVEAQGNGKVLNEEELEFLADPAKAILMANLSSYGSNVLSKEKNAQFVDFEKEINYLKQTLSEQSKEKELLTKTFNVFKNESKEKETKNIDKEIALEKKVKELDNIVCKIGKSFCYNNIKNDLIKFKGKDIVDNAAHVPNTTTMAQGMYNLDLVILAPKVKNYREAHEYYLKHTMEQATILREIVEQSRSLNPIDSASYSACKYVKLIQELLGYVRDTCPNIHKPSEKLVNVTPINKMKIVRFAEPVISSSTSQKQ